MRLLFALVAFLALGTTANESLRPQLLADQIPTCSVSELEDGQEWMLVGVYSERRVVVVGTRNESMVIIPFDDIRLTQLKSVLRQGEGMDRGFVCIS